MPGYNVGREAILFGLTKLPAEEWSMPPRLNQKRARFVLAKIDEIIGWERQTDRERDARFVDLGRYLCEVRAGQYWRLENLKSFDEFLQRRFPESRRKAYYLMSIHEHLPRQIRSQLKQIGWSKAAELAKVARRDPEHAICATWLRKAQEMPKQQFKDEVEKFLTGESEPSDLIYFKLYRTQVPVIEQALEMAARMLGSDRSRGYCLEMICADFLAGVSAETADAGLLQTSLRRYLHLLPSGLQRQFMEEQLAELAHPPAATA